MNEAHDIYIKVDRRLLKIACRDVIMVEADDNYVKFYTTLAPRPYLVRETISRTMKVLPYGFFHRVHRSYIVGLYHIKHIDKDCVNLGDRDIPISRFHARGLHQRFIVLGVFLGKYK